MNREERGTVNTCRTDHTSCTEHTVNITACARWLKPQRTNRAIGWLRWCRRMATNVAIAIHRRGRSARHSKMLSGQLNLAGLPEPPQPERFRLVKFDPIENLYRFISMDVDHDLFGVILTRHWGRVGVAYNTETIPSPSREAAIAFLNRYYAKKRKKGYLDLEGAIENAILVGAKCQKRSFARQSEIETVVSLAGGGDGPLFSERAKGAAGAETATVIPFRARWPNHF